MRPEPVPNPPRPGQTKATVEVVPNVPGIAVGTWNVELMDTYGADPVKTEPIQKGDDWVVTAWRCLSGRLAACLTEVLY
jgi:hypothetical protein